MIECTAVAVAGLRSPAQIPTVTGLSDSAPPFEVVFTPEPPEPPPVEALPPQIPPPPDDAPNEFTLEQPTPPPRAPAPPRPHLPRTPRAENQIGPAQFSEVRANLTHAPRPPYPYEARRAHSTGNGKFLLRFDANGAVAEVTMVQSTGNAVLDQVAASTFRRWRCRPGTYREVYVPISFTLQGAQW